MSSGKNSSSQIANAAARSVAEAHAAHQRGGAACGHFFFGVARLGDAGLVAPQRTESKYRLYTETDVRLLQRALFLRRARGLNPAAIVHVLKGQGIVSAPPERNCCRGSAFGGCAHEADFRWRKWRARPRVSVGFLSALERGQMRSSVATLRRIARFYRTNILSLFEAAEENPGLVRPAQRKILETTAGVRMELLAVGPYGDGAASVLHQPNGGSGESYAHEGEEFLHVLHGEFEIWLGGKEHYV